MLTLICFVVVMLPACAIGYGMILGLFDPIIPDVTHSDTDPE